MPPTPFPVRALYGYEAAEEDDLPFAPGQRVMVDEVLDDDWYHGYYVDSSTGKRLEGIFPINYVEIEVPPSRPSRPRPKEHAKSESKSENTAHELSADAHKDVVPVSEKPIGDNNSASTNAFAATSTSAPAAAPAHDPAHTPAPSSASKGTSTSIPAPLKKVSPSRNTDEDDDWGDNSESEGEEKQIVLKPPKQTHTDPVGEASPEEASKLHASEARENASKFGNAFSASGTVNASNAPTSASKSEAPVAKSDTASAVSSTAGEKESPSWEKKDESPDSESSRSHRNVYDDDANSESEAGAFAPVSSNLAYVSKEAPPKEHEPRPYHESPAAIVNVASKQPSQPEIEKQAYDKIDAVEHPSRPLREAPSLVDEESDSEIPSLPAEEVQKQSTFGNSGGISNTEADFKTRLARFNRGGSLNDEEKTSKVKPEPKKPGRQHTFGRTSNFEGPREEQKRPNRNPDEYKPSVSLKERIAMLQKSQQQEAENAQADVIAEERRKQRRAQLAAEAEANRRARAEAEAREAELKARQEVARKEQLAREQAEADKQQREAAAQRARESESNAGVPVPPDAHPNQENDVISPKSTHEALPSQLSDLHVNDESRPAPPPIPKTKESHEDAETQPSETANAEPEAKSENEADAEPRRKSSSGLPKPPLGFGFGQPLNPAEDKGADDEEQEHSDEDNAEARRIALRERMARLASSTGGLNLGMIMGGGGGAGFGGSGGMPKRERRISRSEYEAMSPAEIEAAEARREAEQSAPINMFGNNAPPPKGVIPENHGNEDEEEGEDKAEPEESAQERSEPTEHRQETAPSTTSDFDDTTPERALPPKVPSKVPSNLTEDPSKSDQSTFAAEQDDEPPSPASYTAGESANVSRATSTRSSQTFGTPKTPSRHHWNTEKFLVSPQSEDFHDVSSHFRFDINGDAEDSDTHEQVSPDRIPSVSRPVQEDRKDEENQVSADYAESQAFHSPMATAPPVPHTGPHPSVAPLAPGAPPVPPTASGVPPSIPPSAPGPRSVPPLAPGAPPVPPTAPGAPPVPHTAPGAPAVPPPSIGTPPNPSTMGSPPMPPMSMGTPPIPPLATGRPIGHPPHAPVATAAPTPPPGHAPNHASRPPPVPPAAPTGPPHAEANRGAPPPPHTTRAPPPPPPQAHPASMASPVTGAVHAAPPPPRPPYHEETKSASPPPENAPREAHSARAPPAVPTQERHRPPHMRGADPRAAPSPPLPAPKATPGTTAPLRTSPPPKTAPAHSAAHPPPGHGVQPTPTSALAPQQHSATSPPPAEPVSRPAHPPSHGPVPSGRNPTFNGAPPPHPVGRPVGEEGYSSSVYSVSPRIPPAPENNSSSAPSPAQPRSSFDSSQSFQSRSSVSAPSWASVRSGVPPNLVSKGETYRMKDKNGQREVLVIHPGWTMTLASYSSSTGELIQKQELPVPSSDAAKLKQVSTRLGAKIVQAAQQVHTRDVPESSSEWCARVLESVPPIISGAQQDPTQFDPAAIGVESYTNIGNASVHQLDEIRPGDVCVCEDATFQGSKGPLQKYQKTYKQSYFVVHDWDGSKRKLHLVDSRKEVSRSNDSKTGVVRIFRAVDVQYLGL